MGNSPPNADEALLQQIATGDTAALEALYDRYARSVYGVALRMLGSAEAAEDLVQDTFWRIWRKSTIYDPGRGKAAPWIMGIAHNLAIDELRRRRVRPNIQYDDDTTATMASMVDVRSNVVEDVLDEEQRRMVRDMLRQIPQEQRAVIELAYFGGLSQSEIAEQLQHPIGTIKTRARLAMQKLRTLLQAQGYSARDD